MMEKIGIGKISGIVLVLITMLIASTAMVSVSAIPTPTVITFDDVPGANPGTDNNPIPDGYKGFNWDTMYVLHESYHPGSGYEYGVVSGQWVAYNAFAGVATVSDGKFDFNGAYLTSAWDELLTVRVTGYRNNIQIYQQDVVVNDDAPTWVNFNFLSVDKLKFESVGGSQFVMDDFTYTADGLNICPDADGDGICDDSDNCPTISNPDQTDSDGDGYGAACECDDSNSKTYPGAPEICDRKDNNCDGVIPGGEIDDDRDGTTECEGDCDDNNPLIYPRVSQCKQLNREVQKMPQLLKTMPNIYKQRCSYCGPLPYPE